MCNQAIMLVTDGVPENFYSLFKLYNWKNGTMGMPVRVFTYLIGREVPEIRDMKWMACANHGKFIHTFIHIKIFNCRINFDLIKSYNKIKIEKNTIIFRVFCSFKYGRRSSRTGGALFTSNGKAFGVAPITPSNYLDTIIRGCYCNFY